MKLRWRVPVALKSVDWWLYIIPILLTGIGIAVIVSLTYGTNRTGLAVSQGIFAALGIGLMLVFARIDYRNWRGLAMLCYWSVIVLLIAVDRFGVTIFGAKRWLAIGGFQLQPSELAKLALVVVLARFFADRERWRARDYLWLVCLVALPVALIMHQPDLGTAVILLLVSLGFLIAGRLPRPALFGVIGAGLLAIPIGWNFLADYQRERVMTFLNPSADPYGAGYNVLQALIAVGSGGLFGQGLGKGSQSQLQFLPVTHTDFIFAGVAEATGLIGSLVLIGLLMFLIVRIIRVAQYAKDSFGYLLGIGCAVLILAQASINISMNIGLAPVTGIPLPFVSHGGTALLTNFIVLGMLQSVIIRHKKITFEH